MDTLASLDWSLLLPTDPCPDSDPTGLAADPWHPPDFEVGLGLAGYAAGSALARVEWMHSANTPAAYSKVDDRVIENGETAVVGDVPAAWASIVHAYQRLPHPLAVESIIFGHVAYLHRLAYNWVQEHLGDRAIRLEQQGKQAILTQKAGKKTKQKGGATIGEDLFSVGLLKIVRLVRLLPRIGKRYAWDDWEAPGHIGRYAGECAKNAIKDYLRKERQDRRHILGYLQRRHTLPKAGRIKSGEVDDVDQLFCNGAPCVAFSTDGSDELAIFQPAEVKDALDHACRDIIDRLLLTMKRNGVLTETQMGQLYGLTRDQVNDRLGRLVRDLQDALALERQPARKRCSRKPEERRLAEEVVASWQCPAKRSVVPPPHFLARPTLEHTLAESCAEG
jgi:hypothetical protein